MNYITNEIKVSKFWNYTEEKIIKDTSPIAQAIISYREKVYNKVLTNEWTKEEAEKFLNIIRKTTANKFYELIDIAETLLEMPIQESSKEIDFLIMTDFIPKSSSNNSKIQELANLICIIQSKLLSISNYSITNEDKNGNVPLEERIKIFEELSTQIKDPNSEYYRLYEDFYKSWVIKTFNSENIKYILLMQQDKIIKIKQKNINNYLKKLYYEKERKKEDSKYVQMKSLETLNKHAKIRRIH